MELCILHTYIQINIITKTHRNRKASSYRPLERVFSKRELIFQLKMRYALIILGTSFGMTFFLFIKFFIFFTISIAGYIAFPLTYIFRFAGYLLEQKFIYLLKKI